MRKISELNYQVIPCDNPKNIKSLHVDSLFRSAIRRGFYTLNMEDMWSKPGEAAAEAGATMATTYEEAPGVSDWETPQEDRLGGAHSDLPPREHGKGVQRIARY